MVDANLFAFGGAVTFIFLAGAYVVFRNRYQELVSEQALAEAASTEADPEDERPLHVLSGSRSGQR